MWSARYRDRVRYLEHPGHANRGMSASRNLGIRHGQGRYVALLDADDVWQPDKLARQVALLEAHPEAELVYGSRSTGTGGRAIRPTSGETGRPGLPVPPGTIVQALRSWRWPRTRSARGSAPCPSDLCFRRGRGPRGGFEEPFHGIYALYEDQAFLAKVYLAAPRARAGERWLRYRQHPHSCVSTVTATGTYETVRRFFLEWLVGYLRDADVRDARVRRAAHRALRAVRHPTLSRLEARGRAVAGRALRLGARVARRLAPRALRPTHGFRRAGAVPGVAAFGSATSGGCSRRAASSATTAACRSTGTTSRRFSPAASGDIRGRVLEVGDDTYTRRFGDAQVTRGDVLHVEPVAGATIVADLAGADHIPSGRFDCVILTQTLHLVYDVRAALATRPAHHQAGRHAARDVPGHEPARPAIRGARHWYWSFTTLAARRLFAEAFPAGEDVAVEAHGNVLATSAFLYGLAAAHELTAPSSTIAIRRTRC